MPASDPLPDPIPTADLVGVLDFLRRAERLKDTVRSGYTSGGRQESVADHTWRLCLMALVLHDRFPDVDFVRLVQVCLVHDLGEAVGGDIPAPEQTEAGGKAEQERRDLLDVLAPLPRPLREHVVALWDEYEAAATPEARLAKALDKLETLLQHTQGANPPGFDYRFNLDYGRRYTSGDPTIEAIRQILDAETERRASATDGPPRPGRRRFYTADVFTDRVFGGNPVAVFPDADGLSDAQMQRVASELNLSETVFVLPPADDAHTRRLRFFTPRMELPYAGHPTLGAAHVLTATGRVPLTGAETRLTFEEGVGPVRVTVRADGGRPVWAQLAAAQMPVFGPEPPPPAVVAAVLSLSEVDLAGEPYRPQAVSCGVPFLIVPVRDLDALGRARLDRGVWDEHLASFWAPHLYGIALDPERPERVRARMFAPAMGIAEDPATGAAASTLAGTLSARADGADGTLRWTVRQGVEMGRPSTLEVEAERRGGEVVAVRVGGTAVLVSEGLMEIPEDGPLPHER